MSDKLKSSGWKNQLKTTLPPKYRAFVEANAAVEKVPESDIIRTAVKFYYDNMPPADRDRIVQQSRNSY